MNYLVVLLAVFTFYSLLGLYIRYRMYCVDQARVKWRLECYGYAPIYQMLYAKNHDLEEVRQFLLDTYDAVEPNYQALLFSTKPLTINNWFSPMYQKMLFGEGKKYQLPKQTTIQKLVEEAKDFIKKYNK